MTTKITISLDDAVYHFLNKVTDNRSKYINELLAREQKVERDRIWREAYLAQERDPEFHKEVELWDCVVGDGIGDEE